MAAQVALKRQQAAEDAIALGLRAISGDAAGFGYLPPGPVWGSLAAANDAAGNKNPPDDSDSGKHNNTLCGTYVPGTYSWCTYVLDNITSMWLIYFLLLYLLDVLTAGALTYLIMTSRWLIYSSPLA